MRTRQEPKSGENSDFVKWGGDRHAALMGLAKAAADSKFSFHGWALMDTSNFGPFVRPDYIQAELEGKVNVLEGPPPTVPAGSPAMWLPDPD